MLSFEITFPSIAKGIGEKKYNSLLLNTTFQTFLKCWSNDFKMNGSAGYQVVDLTKVSMIELVNEREIEKA